MDKEFKEIFKGLSSNKLKELSKEAAKLAEDLEKEEPSYALAIAHGIQDRSYDTTANGWVPDYEGEAIIKMDNGTVWKAIGHGPQGDAWSIFADGYIEFIKIS